MQLYIITGPPYCGKGTQCEVLTKALNLKHISTGDRCREEKENQTKIGLIMSEYQEKGSFVPDSIMQELFSQILDENIHEHGIILDGYPRTIPQVDHLLVLLNEKGLTISKVWNIEVPKEELLKRAQKRAETSTRADDKDINIHYKRIHDFQNLTLPAIEYMKTKMEVVSFDGMGSVEEVTNKIQASIFES
jgi:adenylate kinase